MKKITLALALSLVAASAMAVPARHGSFSHTQKDGTRLTLQLVGDEYFHYYRDLATGNAMRLTADGDYEIFDNTTFRSAEENANIRRTAANEQRIMRLPKMNPSTGGPKKSIGDFGSMSGSKKGLVILVNYTDVTFKSANTRQAFDDQFNRKGYSKNGHIGSVSDYFYDQSYGKFSLDFDVVGPVTVAHSMAYYGANDAYGNDVAAARMIVEAVNLADTQCNVDYTKYDWDGDGEVDQVFVIYAGYNEAQMGPAESIWPHEWDLTSARVGAQTLDGKVINTYACTSELCGYEGSTIDGIGTACHEFSHCLGYPDFYDTSGGDAFGMGALDVMCSGSYNGPNNNGEVPCGYTAYERWMAGWLTPETLSEPRTISGMKNLGEQPEAYIFYNDKTNNEYFLLENRQADRWFKYCHYIEGVHGLLITHVDYNKSAWVNNNVNNTASHQRMTFVPADNKYEETYENNGNTYLSTNELRGDLFPGYKNVTAFTSTSHTGVNGKYFNKTSAGNYALLNQDVTDIVEKDGTISFNFNGGSPADLYTVTLNPCGGTVATTTWTQTRKDEAWNIPEPQTSVTGWTGIGWYPSAITVDTPLDDILDDDFVNYGNYTPTADVKLYAVYATNNEICNSYPYDLSGKKTPDFYFPHLAKVGEPFTAPKLKTNSNGALTYSSSDTSVATVDAKTGAVTIKGVGTAIITVNQAETAAYTAGKASYMIKVTD